MLPGCRMAVATHGELSMRSPVRNSPRFSADISTPPRGSQNGSE